MSDCTKNETLTQKSRPVDEKDNSFDAEFSLLENTLTELKEDEHVKADQNQTNRSSSEVGLSDVTCVKLMESEASKEASVNNKSPNTSKSGNSLQFPESKNIILSNGTTSSFGEEASFSISSTTLLFKSTDKIDNITNNPLGSLKHSVHTGAKNLSSSCKRSPNYLAQKENNVLHINPNSQTAKEENELVIVTQCDSSSEEDRKVQYTAIEFNIFSNIEPIDPQNMDSSCEGKHCDPIKVTNIDDLESSEPDVLNLEYSPIPSPCDPNLIQDVALEETHDIEEPIHSVDDLMLVDQNLCKTGTKPLTDQSDMIELASLKPLDKSIDKSKDNEDIKIEKNAVNCSSLQEYEEGRTNYDICVPEFNNPDLAISSQTIFQAEPKENMSCKLDHVKDESLLENKTNTDVKIIGEEEDSKEAKTALYCSTPIAPKEIRPIEEEVHISETGIDRSFGQMSPLQSWTIRNKNNRKRKHLGLECIKEVDEDAPYVCIDKKMKKSIGDCKENLESTTIDDEQNISSSAMPCFEPPAKSILKKWLPSCLSRNSGTSFLILDECGESDVEESTKPKHDVDESAADDFEVAYKSLTEELMKSSSNIETLEKYHSQVQLESQMDNDKFDEVLQELTSNYDLDDKTSLSLKTMDESALSEMNQTCIELEQDCLMAKEGNGEMESLLSNKILNKTLNRNISSNLENKTYGVIGDCIKIGTHGDTVIEDKSPVSSKSKDEEVINLQTLPSNKHEQLATCSATPKPEVTSHLEKLPNQNADGKGLTMDEEDFLLEDNISTKNKPYVFFEFVSSDPKENEDNYNPEWQKLGRLTSDEERYKAVRDRWRSLVPPDPNRDLTCRQWRERNRKPPLNNPSLNNNHQMHEDNERNQLCTAVFDMKIQRIVQEVENSRMNIMRDRNIAFQELACAQDKEQRSRRGLNGLDLIQIHKRHIEECCQLKDQYDLQLKQLTRRTEDKLRILKEASDEVLMFQKFYKGVGSGNDEVCLYMTDIQVQELVETEDMLEQYAKFYQ